MVGMECVSDWFVWCLALVLGFWVVRNVAAKPPGQEGTLYKPLYRAKSHEHLLRTTSTHSASNILVGMRLGALPALGRV
jgi:hypothetical protein